MTFHDLIFPDGFLWGSAASAHQTEGGTYNDWTEWEKIPGRIKDGSNASIACDHYNRYEEDFDLAKKLGHQVHRFSIEWSRIEPSQGKWNATEIAHYEHVVQALVSRGIRPMVTLHHFTNPLWFWDNGGWLNADSPHIFAGYVRKIVEALAEYNIIWNTINEPLVLATLGYLFGEFPPGYRDFDKALTVARHLLMAHGLAASQICRTYEERGLDRPEIAPVISATYFMPADPSNPEDIELAQYLDEVYNHAWIRGAITATLPEPIGNGSKYVPLQRSVDFIGLNYYSRMLVSSELDFLAGEMPPKDPNLERCEGLDWEVYPEGYYHIIKSMWERYHTPIFLTENGIGTLDDMLRCRYILTHLQQVHRAISEGVDIRGYLVWSLTDNFEWTYGFGSHFGLVAIDHQTLQRTPRESALMFHEIVTNNGLTAELQERFLGRRGR